MCLRVVFDLLRHSLRGHGCSLHIDGTRVLENSSTVQAPTVCRAQVLADMKPSFTRTSSSVSDIDIDVDEHGRGPDGFLHYGDYPPGLSPSQQDGDGAGGATPRSEASYGEGAAEEFEEELDEEFDQEFDGSDGSYGSYGSSEGGRRSSDEGPDAPGDDAGDSCGEGDSYDGPRPPSACAHGGGPGAGPFPRPGDSRGSSAALRFARDGRVIGCGLARAWLSFPTYGRLVAHLAARLFEKAEVLYPRRRGAVGDASFGLLHALGDVEPVGAMCCS